jgi:hypothetical protein
MDNPEKLTTYGTQDEDKQNKNKNTTMLKPCQYVCHIFAKFLIQHCIFHGRHSHIIIAGFSFFCRRITLCCYSLLQMVPGCILMRRIPIQNHTAFHWMILQNLIHLRYMIRIFNLAEMVNSF